MVHDLPTGSYGRFRLVESAPDFVLAKCGNSSVESFARGLGGDSLQVSATRLVKQFTKNLNFDPSSGAAGMRA